MGEYEMIYEKPRPILSSHKALDIGSALHGHTGKGKVFI